MINFNSKVYLVTGGSSGIGLEVCKKLLNSGAKVYCGSRNHLKYIEVLYSWALGVGLENNVFWIQLNFDSEISIEAASKNLPELDGVVNCAGISSVLPLKLMKSSQLLNVLMVNLISPIELIRVLLKSKKLKKAGSLVFISSINGTTTGSKGHSIYAAAKSGINGFIMSLSNELSKQLIRVNGVAPGLVKTELYNEVVNFVSTEQMDLHLQKYPLGEGKVTDIADVVYFLLSNESKWITGQTIVVDGGYSIS
jgi:NAD(P)-dependent dehydrogenase (short-subunit alcohol dehydrogenase family)